MSKGWVKAYRSLADHQMWLSEPFTRGQAFMDLVMLANSAPGFIRKRGIRVEIKRGQVGRSETSFSKRWKWSRGKVRRFLREMEQQSDPMIVQQKTNICTVITIVNYEKYQGDGTANSTPDSTPNGTANGQQTVQQTVQQTDTNKNKENKKNKEKRRGGRFSPPSIEQVGEYCSKRGNSVDPERFVDFYTAKGWMVGKNRMKDWQAAVRNWERRDVEQGLRLPKVGPKASGFAKQSNEGTDYVFGE